MSGLKKSKITVFEKYYLFLLRAVAILCLRKDSLCFRRLYSLGFS